MEQVITTIFFDGQFWIALIEKIGSDGCLSVGKHVFGAEPSNPELVEFMLGVYSGVPVFPGSVRVRSSRVKKAREEARVTDKAKASYKTAQKEYLAGRANARSEARRMDAQEKYVLKRERKKSVLAGIETSMPRDSDRQT